MKESRFLELINSLSSVDLDNLKFYVESKLFNKNKNVHLLYSIVLNFPAGRRLNDAILIEKFNQNKKITPPNFRMLLTEFSNLIEIYIIHKKINDDELRKQKYLMEYSLDNNLRFLTSKSSTKIESLLKNKIDLNLDEKSVKLIYLLRSYLISGNRGLLNKFHNAGESLWQEVLLRELNYSSGKLSLTAKKIIDNLSESILQKNDLYLYYYYLLFKIKSGDLSKVKALEKIFKKTVSIELKNLISEFMINSEEAGNQEQLKYALWYWDNSSPREKKIHADKLLFIALRSYESELSKKIIKYLPTETGFFSKALYYFYVNDFTVCLAELDKINNENKDLDMKVRQLKMCCYARLGHHKKFNNGYYAFKKFVIKYKNLKSVKETEKFCEILFLIINNMENINKLLKLKKLITGEEIANKSWLENELEFHLKKIV